MHQSGPQLAGAGTQSTAVKAGLSPQFLRRDDIAKGWGGDVTSADAFSHYYSYFTRDQDYFEANMAKLKVPVKVVWGEQNIYISKEMGIEYANRNGVKLSVLPKLGHFPHLQAPEQTVDEVRAAFLAVERDTEPQ